jgi:antitoxin ParD1/3/4
MPTRNVNLTDELDRFVDGHIVDGQYANASEVFRAGLRALDQQERLYEAKLERVRSAIDGGLPRAQASVVAGRRVHNDTWAAQDIAFRVQNQAQTPVSEAIRLHCEQLGPKFVDALLPP